MTKDLVKRAKNVIDGVPHTTVRFTTHCSGCTELGENMGDAHLYPYDAKSRCYVGMGCHECGYTGKRRRIELVPDHVLESCDD
jgi:hypothetical protein